MNQKGKEKEKGEKIHKLSDEEKEEGLKRETLPTKKKKKAPSEKRHEYSFHSETSKKNLGDLERKEEEKRSLTHLDIDKFEGKFSTGMGGKSYGSLSKKKRTTETRRVVVSEPQFSLRATTSEKRTGALERKGKRPCKFVFPSEVMTEYRAEKQEEKKVKVGESTLEMGAFAGAASEEVSEGIEEAEEFETDFICRGAGISDDIPYVLFLKGDDLFYRLWKRLVIDEMKSRGKAATSNEIDIRRIGKGREEGPRESIEFERYIRGSRLLEIGPLSENDLKTIVNKDTRINSFFRTFLGRGDLYFLLCRVDSDVRLEETSGEGGVNLRNILTQRLKEMEELENQIFFREMHVQEEADTEKMREFLASLLDIPSWKALPSTLVYGTSEEEPSSQVREWINLLDRNSFSYQEIMARFSSDLDKNVSDFGDQETESPQHLAMKMLVYESLKRKNLQPELNHREELPIELDNSETVEIEYPGELKIGDLYVPKRGLWIEVETGRLPRGLSMSPLDHIFRKLVNLQSEEEISELWLVLPLRKLITWGERNIQNLRSKLVDIVSILGLNNRQVRIKFCDFRQEKLRDFFR